MRKIKNFVWAIIRQFATLYFFVCKPHKKLLTVFLYHEVGDIPSGFTGPNYLCVSNKTFQKQISWINNNFNIIHPDDLLTNKELPESPALITFDDGFLGAFENGINHLIEKNIPSLMFLNMSNIISGKPIAASLIYYVSETRPEFDDFAKKAGVASPYRLNMSQHNYERFVQEFGAADETKVLKYQGKLAPESLIRTYNDRKLVVYGNHLFEHWNAAVLTDEEFDLSYRRNNAALLQLSNSINMFGFPFGQPYSCFSQKHIEALNRLGASKVFYSSGGTNDNKDAFVLNRVALTELDNSQRKFWVRILFGIFLGNKPFKNHKNNSAN